MLRSETSPLGCLMLEARMHAGKFQHPKVALNAGDGIKVALNDP